MIISAVASALVPAPGQACVPFTTVDFAFGSARLDRADLVEIRDVARKFRATRDSRVSVMAQSDGSRANLRLSHRRADVVKAALIRLGVPAAKIDVETLIGRKALVMGDGYARWVHLEVDAAPTC